MHKTYIQVTIIVGIIIVFSLFGYFVVKGIYDFYYPAAANNPTTLEAFLKLAGVGLTLVTSVMTAFVTLTNVFIQISTSRQIEKMKPLLTVQYSAYKELNAAAIAIFDAFSRLQNNKYNVDYAYKADEELTSAAGNLFFMPEDYQKVWTHFQDRARFAKEEIDNALKAFDKGEEYRLIIKDEKQVEVVNQLVESQEQLWFLMHTTVWEPLQKLRQTTPHAS